tara:strand:- start:3531 stop:3980 length:450 start_codon:yes stop_codon:yes gene_type:complete
MIGPLLSQLAWELRYLSSLAQTAHWLASGPSSYSDHQLYRELYVKLDSLLDPIAEQAVFYGSDVDPVNQSRYILTRMLEYSGEFRDSSPDFSLFFQRQLDKLVRNIRAILTEIPFHGGGDTPLGLEDLLTSSAGEISSFRYFLSRRSLI